MLSLINRVQVALVVALTGALAVGPVPASALETAATDIVLGTSAAVPSLSDVSIEPTATGFDVSFHYTQYEDGEPAAWKPVRLGVYDGDSIQFPFESRTVVDHGYGTGPAESLVPDDGTRTGQVSRAFEHDRGGDVTVMLFSSEPCDCPGGTVFAAGRTLAAVPLVTGTPTIAGSLAVDTEAVVDPGIWSDGTDLTFQWFADGQPLADATDRSLQLTAELVGSALRVDVTGRFAGRDPVTVSSAASRLVVQPGTVAVTGSAVAGETLGLALDGWAPDTTFTYEWFADGVIVPGATASTLQLPDTAIGRSVTARVTGQHATYAAASAVSAAVTVVARTPITSRPVVSGDAAVGATLTAVPGAWTTETTFSYQWLVDSIAVAGATRPTFALDAAHVGRSVAVTVTGSRSGYSSASETSEPTPLVVAPGTPSVTGTPSVGSTLTAAPGTWATGTSLAYQWYADGAAVPRATGAKLTLTTAQDGAAVTVAVTGSRPGYATIVRSSAATLRVMRWSTPTMSGTFAYGTTLTARPGTWTSGTTFRYQWYADGKAISGATASTVTLGSGQRDRRMSVRVVGSKPGHPSVTAFSAASGKVLTTGTPSISGTPVWGATLSARPGTWTAATTFSYVWMADGTVISGATASTLRLSSLTRGKRISVRVTGRKSGYATVVRASGSTARVATAATPSVSGSRLVTYTLTANAGTWTSGTTFSHQWYANGAAIRGATRSTLKLGTSLVGKRISVKLTGSKSGYPTVARFSASTAAVGYPSRTSPVSEWSCPSWAPIKGNGSSMIYHVPSGQFYSRTKPEECFRTETAARSAGYRKSQR
ncbi:MAG: hypothetical protein ACRCYR_04210 [Phycicoccus sp.]